MSNFRENIIYWKDMESLIETKEKLNNRVFPDSQFLISSVCTTLFQTTTTPHLHECRSLLIGPQASAPALPQAISDLVKR